LEAVITPFKVIQAFKVTDFGTNRKLIYDFLLVINSLLTYSGVKARGRPRRAWIDYLKDWTELRNYSELKRTEEDRTFSKIHV